MKIQVKGEIKKKKKKRSTDVHCKHCLFSLHLQKYRSFIDFKLIQIKMSSFYGQTISETTTTPDFLSFDLKL